MSLFSRILGTGILGILLAVIVASIAVICGNLHRNTQEQENLYRNFCAQVNAAESAHLVWVRKINNSLLSESATLNIVTDGNECAFGEWYYSEGQNVVNRLDPSLKRGFQNVERNHLEVHKLGHELVRRWNSENRKENIDYFLTKIAPLVDTLLTQLNELNTKSQTFVDERRAQGEKILWTQYISIIFVLVIGMAVLIPSTYLTATNITQSLNRGVRLAEDLEHGNVTTRLNMNRNDEIGTLASALDKAANMIEKRAEITARISHGDLTPEVKLASQDDSFGQALLTMIESLRKSIDELSTVAVDVNTNSDHLAKSSEALSTGTQRDAGQLSSMSEKLQEITSHTQENARNAQEATQTANSAQQAAATGQEKVRQMVNSMDAITQSAQEIRKIIRVIDDIAFQTNLLALNAAVEAARAGTHGKGFAVVAEEVRNLASRSAKSAGETGKMIEETLKQVETGSLVANETVKSLSHIAEEVGNVNELITKISVNASSQAEGLKHLNEEVNELTQSTTGKSASAEETASMAVELSHSAELLQNVIAKFQLPSRR